MLHTPVRYIASVLSAVLLLTPSSFAFDTPLSDQAVREAYFLGQRHDESLARFLDKYTRHLPPPKSGPYISSIGFLTPFAQSTQFSSNYVGNYSAQQALLNHRGQKESIKIRVEIYLTTSYGALIANPDDSRSSSVLIPRPYDFWKDFQVQVYTNGQALSPAAFRGKPTSRCGRTGHCTLTGATLELEFPAESFATDTATIQVIPPEGDPVSVDFDLIRLR